MLNLFLEQVSGMSLKNPKFLVPGTTSHSILQKSEPADLFLEQLLTQVLKIPKSSKKPPYTLLLLILITTICFFISTLTLHPDSHPDPIPNPNPNIFSVFIVLLLIIILIKGTTLVTSNFAF